LQPLPLDDILDASALSAVPNPKPSAADKRGYGSMASLYTAFSTDFARFALELCVSEGHRTILDPFAGMGTVGEAGRLMPIQLLLNDLNPFASLSSAFRTAAVSEIAESIGRISKLTLCSALTPEREAFDSAIRQKLGDTLTPAALINRRGEPNRRAALLDIHLISLIRIATHKRLRGSNPTWTKRSTDEMIDPTSFDAARSEVVAAARSYASRLDELNDAFSAVCSCGAAADLQIEDGAIDAIITSPPYPNRTDYIRHYLPAAEILIGGDDGAERALRQAQIGTPLIRHVLPAIALPASVESLIDRIRTHGSYASERYYAKGFQYYFADMSSTFDQMRRWLKPSGIAVVVVQDTYYKEVRVPVGDLLVDVARSAGLGLEARKDFPVRHALSRLSAKARASAPSRAAVESVLMFRRQ